MVQFRAALATILGDSMRIQLAAATAVGLSSWSALALAKPVELVLRLQERVPMAQLAQAVSDATSPRYRQFYTPQELRDVAAPTAADYEQLLAQLAVHGFTVVAES